MTRVYKCPECGTVYRKVVESIATDKGLSCYHHYTDNASDESIWVECYLVFPDEEATR